MIHDTPDQTTEYRRQLPYIDNCYTSRSTNGRQSAIKKPRKYSSSHVPNPAYLRPSPTLPSTPPSPRLPHTSLIFSPPPHTALETPLSLSLASRLHLRLTITH
ncbi:uncharacterized protein BDZ99DRAFT_463020 [Mytilinidion resinicola]|uniref:Uncharacterized protein n=1 Tax=Mytilinidion resinicola TaxID=574789 RepID=A0A6A6YNT3_9PEZI|nr:uncharacterized protein BDZ99DRAFT_463020 [Mytilinidion resinicola]KAF2810440.1 hypothetical protein BDZ99DRAFT_463020 [Mytilinidion resinicola]